ncbi:MAG: MBL fold metallo-hydrolase [Desulfobacteraceae bacterium]|jgi:glyoxylase-like metal-dependent hydrolase (beta-lactamase superfamily II)
MREVMENIYCITQKFRWSMFKPPANIYVIAGEKGIIFDSGYGTFYDLRFFRKEYLKILEDIKKKGIKFKPACIIPSHSHGDHFSGLQGIRKFTKAKVCLTRQMAEVLTSKKELIRKHRVSGSPVRILWKEERTKAAGRWDLIFPHIFGLKFLNDPDIIISENDKINDGEKDWRIIPVKGHCDDHIALFNEQTGIMFCGDNILQNIITWLGPPRSDIEDYCRSLQTVFNLKNLKVILPAHGRPVTEPKKRIREILAHRRNRTKDVIDIISRHKNGIRFRHLRDMIYSRGTKFWVKSSGEGWILSTIDFLMKKRLVRLSKANGITKIVPRKKIFDENEVEKVLAVLFKA